MTEDKKIIAEQGKRIDALEAEIHSIYDELASIRNVTGGLIKHTGIMSKFDTKQH